METYERRYDIDWLRVIAIGLLLVYHGFPALGSFHRLYAKPGTACWIVETHGHA